MAGSNPHKPALSVVMAFHNAAATLPRALEPFAVTSLCDVQLIMVNDGSTDMGLKVACAFLQQHTDLQRRAIVLSHPFRRGIAEATASGMNVATGLYVTRCDADDFVEADALREAIDVAMRSGSDIVWSPAIHEYRPGRERLIRTETTDLNRMKYSTVNFALWNKLIRRTLLTENNIYPFAGINCWEDVGMVARVLTLNPRITHVGRPYYHYVRREGTQSLSLSRKDILLHDHLLCALYLDEWFTANDLSSEYREFLTHLKFVAKIKYLRGQGKDVALWKSTFPETNRAIMSISQIALHHRVALWIINKLPIATVQRAADFIDRFYRHQ